MISEIIELVLHMNDAEMMKTMTLRMACHPAASPLLETFLMVSPNHLLKLFNVVFLPSIEDLAMDGYGNFALQRMLSLLSDSRKVFIFYIQVEGGQIVFLREHINRFTLNE